MKTLTGSGLLTSIKSSDVSRLESIFARPVEREGELHWEIPLWLAELKRHALIEAVYNGCQSG